MARKTREDALATRARILEAATELFGRQGVAHTSLNDIARAAGVTRGAIYWHFDNKVAMFTAMIERLVCPLLMKSPERQRLMAENPLGFVRAALAEFMDKLVGDARFRHVFEIFWHKCEYVGDMAAIRNKHLEEGENHIDTLQQALALAQEKGQIGRCLNPHQAAIGLAALVDGLTFNWTKDQSLFPLQDYGMRLVDTFLAGLGACLEEQGDGNMQPESARQRVAHTATA